MIITIDGPAGSGKSSTARAIAHQLGMHYLRTGLLYRAAALLLLRRYHGQQQIFELLKNSTPQDIAALAQILYEYIDGEPVVFLGTENLMGQLENQELDYASSIISSNPVIRQALMHIQRSVAERYDLVAEGRDCGSVVFPQAAYKFFLTARPEIRAKRVLHDLKRHIKNTTVSDVLQAINERDERDKVRSVSPLIAASDAHIIDNSDLTFNQTVEQILAVIKPPVH